MAVMGPLEVKIDLSQGEVIEEDKIASELLRQLQVRFSGYTIHDCVEKNGVRVGAIHRQYASYELVAHATRSGNEYAIVRDNTDGYYYTDTYANYK